MKIIFKRFDKENKDTKKDVNIACFCGCDWHGCDCEYNCENDDDCTQDTDPR